ncbi:hypothetical protein HJG60_011638 [Phyllostomus discolor]|uniref:Uncharacterized protein n=1 Tax=Phyllostomus discolor TaxID=89673 RepID=A0A833ZU13_9CHIR|nr:hypothetical protein HJG60_011638 [Phyllostomus discolor]
MDLSDLLRPPAPAQPRGSLPRARAPRVGGRIPGARQAGLGTALHTHLSVFASRVEPPGGVADASGFFLSVFVRFICEQIALGSGKGRDAPSFPPTPGAWDVQDHFPRPRTPPPPGPHLLGASGPASQRPAPPPSPRPLPHSVANFRPSMPKPRRRLRPKGPPHWPPPL